MQSQVKWDLHSSYFPSFENLAQLEILDHNSVTKYISQVTLNQPEASVNLRNQPLPLCHYAQKRAQVKWIFLKLRF